MSAETSIYLKGYVEMLSKENRKKTKKNRNHYALVRHQLGSAFQTYVREDNISISELKRLGMVRARALMSPQQCKGVSIDKAIGIMVYVGLSVRICFRDSEIVICKDKYSVLDCTNYLIRYLLSQVPQFTSLDGIPTSC